MSGGALTAAGMLSASRVLGFVRDLLFAALLGGGAGADLFTAVFRGPDFLRKLLAEGFVSQAAAPLFRPDEGAESSRRARFVRVERSVRRWGAAIGVGVAVATALGFAIFSPAPGAAGLGFMGLYLAFAGSTGLYLARLHVAGRFVAFGASPVLFNLVVIAAAGLGLAFGTQALATLSAAVALAGFGQWLWAKSQAVELAEDDSPIPEDGVPVDWAALGAGAVHTLRVLVAFAFQPINLVLGSLAALWIGPGAAAGLYFADGLFQLPLSLAGSSIALAALPQALTSREGPGGAGVAASTRLTFCIGIGAAAGLAALSPSIVETLFAHGAFGPDAVDRTSLALRGLCFGLPAAAAARPLLAGLHAAGIVAPPARAGVVATAASFTLCVLLGGLLGIFGLGLGLSTGLWLFWLALDRIGRRTWGFPTSGPSKFWRGRVGELAAGALMAGLALWLDRGLGSSLVSVGLVPVYALLYGGLAAMFGSAEAKSMLLAVWALSSTGVRARIGPKTGQ